MSEFRNRAFMYGESVFTTMRMINGVVQDWEEHFDRLRRGVHFVFGPFKDSEHWSLWLKERLWQLCQSEKGDLVLRVSLYREQERGLKAPDFVNIQDLKIAVTTLPFDISSFNPPPQNLRFCPGPQRPQWWPSYLKAGSYLESILAQKLFLKDEDDDLLFLNVQNEVLETPVANIFCVINNQLYTPCLGPQVLDGVMRKKIISRGREFFEAVHEISISQNMILGAEAVFGSNSVKGVFLVGKIDGNNYFYHDKFLKKFEDFRKRVYE